MESNPTSTKVLPSANTSTATRRTTNVTASKTSVKKRGKITVTTKKASSSSQEEASVATVAVQYETDSPASLSVKEFANRDPPQFSAEQQNDHETQQSEDITELSSEVREFDMADGDVSVGQLIDLDFKDPVTEHEEVKNEERSPSPPASDADSINVQVDGEAENDVIDETGSRDAQTEYDEVESIDLADALPPIKSRGGILSEADSGISRSASESPEKDTDSGSGESGPHDSAFEDPKDATVVTNVITTPEEDNLVDEGVVEDQEQIVEEKQEVEEVAATESAAVVPEEETKEEDIEEVVEVKEAPDGASDADDTPVPQAQTAAETVSSQSSLSSSQGQSAATVTPSNQEVEEVPVTSPVATPTPPNDVTAEESQSQTRKGGSRLPVKSGARSPARKSSRSRERASSHGRREAEELAAQQTQESQLQKNKAKYGHVQSKISSRPSRPSARRGAAEETNVQPHTENAAAPAAETANARSKKIYKNKSHSIAGTAAGDATAKRVQFHHETDEDENYPLDDEAPAINSTQTPNIISFQEPQSMVKHYIKGSRNTGPTKPKIVKQRTVDVSELQYKQKLTPLPDKNAKPAMPVKETAASRKRLEKLHQESQRQLELQEETLYMTPLQRKELEVKELRRQLSEAYFVIEQRELELDVFHHNKAREMEDLGTEKDDVIKSLEDRMTALQESFDESVSEKTDSNSKIVELREKIDALTEEAAARESRHQEVYLSMYNKGRESAKFERQDEIEKLAVEEPDKVSVEELLAKLEKKEQELEKWQAVKLTETYEESVVPGTEAEAQLRFMRDSMYHYITDAQHGSPEQHLRAMIGMFNFTDVQMKTIQKCLDERKKKGKI